ncbi:hypothetical protein [Prosthecobacter sp.]|jgi:hypothetical protein|uniref:hypothetical protein n=1 Tax=Prosthecobacter sp. TaxID=1965333 RepID=UPI0037C5893A
MNPSPSPPITSQPLRFSVEAARQLLEEALEAEKSVNDTEAGLAQKRAINAYTGASAMIPPEVITTAATAAAEQKQAV